MNIIIPMAGRGSRTNDLTSIPKPLIPIKGKSMIDWVIKSLKLKGNYFFITRRYAYKEWNVQLNKILDNTCPGCKIIEIDYITEGPACSALIPKNDINNNEPLIVVNCDQIMHWDSQKFLETCNREDLDGVLVTQNKSTIKNSYIALDEKGYGIAVKEKEIISSHALTGLHFWKKGRYFVESTEEMIAKNIRYNNEFYIAPTYNFLIDKNLKIGIHEIELHENWPTGTTEDITNFIKYYSYENL